MHEALHDEPEDLPLAFAQTARRMLICGFTRLHVRFSMQKPCRLIGWAQGTSFRAEKRAKRAILSARLPGNVCTRPIFSCAPTEILYGEFPSLALRCPYLSRIYCQKSGALSLMKETALRDLRASDSVVARHSTRSISISRLRRTSTPPSIRKFRSSVFLRGTRAIAVPVVFSAWNESPTPPTTVTPS